MTQSKEFAAGRNTEDDVMLVTGLPVVNSPPSSEDEVYVPQAPPAATTMSYPAPRPVSSSTNSTSGSNSGDNQIPTTKNNEELKQMKRGRKKRVVTWGIVGGVTGLLAFGPIGGIVGGLIGAYGSKARRKRMERRRQEELIVAQKTQQENPELYNTIQLAQKTQKENPQLYNAISE